MPDTSEVCTICRGRKSEHIDEKGVQISRHAFTTMEGDLVTPEQMAKRQAPQQTARVQIPATMAGNVQLGRLVEVLLEKGLLTAEEALYVGMMGPKPELQSGYRDPAMVMEVNR